MRLPTSAAYKKNDKEQDGSGRSGKSTPETYTTHLLDQHRHCQLLLRQPCTLPGQPGPVVPLAGPHSTDARPGCSPGRAGGVRRHPGGARPDSSRSVSGLLLLLVVAVAAVVAVAVAAVAVSGSGGVVSIAAATAGQDLSSNKCFINHLQGSKTTQHIRYEFAGRKTCLPAYHTLLRARQAVGRFTLLAL